MWCGHNNNGLTCLARGQIKHKRTGVHKRTHCDWMSHRAEQARGYQLQYGSFVTCPWVCLCFNMLLPIFHTILLINTELWPRSIHKATCGCISAHHISPVTLQMAPVKVAAAPCALWHGLCHFKPQPYKPHSFTLQTSPPTQTVTTHACTHVVHAQYAATVPRYKSCTVF